MSLTQLPPLDPSSPTFRADVDTFFRSRIQAFVTEANAMAANLNSIAAGGAYAIPYLLSGNVGAIGAGGYLTSPGNGFLYLDNIDARGANVASLLSTMVASTSNVKGVLRLTKQGDPNSWQEFSVSGPFNQTGALGFAITYVAGSGGISPGDSVLVDFSRTGDKGDTGPAFVPKIMLIRDQKGPGVSPQTIPAGVWTTRDINTVTINQIADAYVTGNKLRLPPGKFWIEAAVPIMQSGAFTTRLFNVVSNSMHDMGTSGFAATGGSPSSTYSLISSFFESTVPHEFRIEHLVGITAPGGNAHPSEVNFYTQIKVTQVG